MRARSLIAGLAALSLAFPAFAQQTVVGGPGTPPATSGGAGNPGGSTTQLQYNNAGAFGGISTLTNVAGVITNSASATGAVEQLTGTETASTSSAMFYIDPAATATTTFSASGTLLGVNGVTGFVGNLIDLQTNGTSVFKIAGGGAVSATGNIATTGSFNPTVNYQKNGANIITATPTSITTAQGMGTTPAILGNSSLGFQATVGASPTAGTFQINFPTASTRGYACTAADTTTLTNVITQVGFPSTSAVTMQNYVRTTGLAGALTASDVIVFQCAAF